MRLAKRKRPVGQPPSLPRRLPQSADAACPRLFAKPGRLFDAPIQTSGQPARAGRPITNSDASRSDINRSDINRSDINRSDINRKDASDLWTIIPRTIIRHPAILRPGILRPVILRAGAA